MAETFYQGSKDAFLTKVRAQFDVIEDQSMKSSKALMTYSLMGTDPNANTLFTIVSNTTEEGDRTVWRHVGVTGINKLDTRSAGGIYPDAEFIRTYETAVLDPDDQDAAKIQVPDERAKKESNAYAQALSRARKLVTEVNRREIADMFEVFNLAFTAPGSYANAHYFARGNKGLDGAFTALGERMVSTQHARADGGATQSNAALESGNSASLNDDSYWAAREQGAAFKDDIGKEFPAFGGMVSIIVPPANGLVKTAKQLQDSEWEIGNAENQINVHKGMFTRVIASPFLLVSQTDSTIANTAQFHLVDDSTRDADTGTGLVCINFVPTESSVVRENDVDSVAYRIKRSKSYGFVEWRNVISSNGTGASYTS